MNTAELLTVMMMICSAKCVEGFDKQIDCRQTPDRGSCSRSIPMYYYDPNEVKCFLFTYSGCGGNLNRHATESDCIANCRGVLGGPGVGTSRNPPVTGERIRRKNPDICYKPIDGGCYFSSVPVVALRYFVDEAKPGSCRSAYYCKADWVQRGFNSSSECERECDNSGRTTKMETSTPPLVNTWIPQGGFTRSRTVATQRTPQTSTPTALKTNALDGYAQQDYQCDGDIVKSYRFSDAERCAQYCESSQPLVDPILKACVAFTIYREAKLCDLHGSCEKRVPGNAAPSWVRKASGDNTQQPTSAPTWGTQPTQWSQWSSPSTQWYVYTTQPNLWSQWTPRPTDFNPWSTWTQQPSQWSAWAPAQTQTTSTPRAWVPTTTQPSVVNRYVVQNNQCDGSLMKIYSNSNREICAQYCEGFQPPTQPTCVAFTVYEQVGRCVLHESCQNRITSSVPSWVRQGFTSTQSTYPPTVTTDTTAPPGALGHYNLQPNQCDGNILKSYSDVRSVTDDEMCALYCDTYVPPQPSQAYCVAFTHNQQASRCDLHGSCQYRVPNSVPSWVKQGADIALPNTVAPIFMQTPKGYTRLTNQCDGSVVTSYPVADPDTCALYCNTYQAARSYGSNCVAFTVFQQARRCDLHQNCQNRIPSSIPSYLKQGVDTTMPNTVAPRVTQTPDGYTKLLDQCDGNVVMSYPVADPDTCALYCNTYQAARAYGSNCVAFTVFQQARRCDLHQNCQNRIPSSIPSYLKQSADTTLPNTVAPTVSQTPNGYTKLLDQCDGSVVMSYPVADPNTCALYCNTYQAARSDGPNCVAFTVFQQVRRCDLHQNCQNKIPSSVPSYLRQGATNPIPATTSMPTNSQFGALNHYTRQIDQCDGNIVRSYQGVTDAEPCAQYCDSFQICVAFTVFQQAKRCDLHGNCYARVPSSIPSWSKHGAQNTPPLDVATTTTLAPTSSVFTGALNNYVRLANQQCNGDLIKSYPSITDADPCARYCDLYQPALPGMSTCAAFTVFQQAKRCDLYGSCKIQVTSSVPSWVKQGSVYDPNIAQNTVSSAVTVPPLTGALSQYTRRTDQCDGNIVKSYPGITEADNCAQYCDIYQPSQPSVQNCVAFTVFKNAKRCDLHGSCATTVTSSVPSWSKLGADVASGQPASVPASIGSPTVLNGYLQQINQCDGSVITSFSASDAATCAQFCDNYNKQPNAVNMPPCVAFTHYKPAARCDLHASCQSRIANSVPSWIRST